jgi:hypothetical protein
LRHENVLGVSIVYKFVLGVVALAHVDKILNALMATTLLLVEFRSVSKVSILFLEIVGEVLAFGISLIFSYFSD